MAIPRDLSSFLETQGHFLSEILKAVFQTSFIYMYIYLGMAESKGYTKTMLQVMTSLWPLGAHGTGLLVLTLRTWQIPTNAVH